MMTCRTTKREHATPGVLTHPQYLVMLAYVENRTPGPWRIWWISGLEEDMITIVTLGPHP